MFAPASPAQARPCRLRAAKIWHECGVPLARLPSSSSAARRVRNREPAAQPSEVQGTVAVWQTKAAEAVGRLTYQRRSVTAQDRRSRVGQVAVGEVPHRLGDDVRSQCPSWPQGPL